MVYVFHAALVRPIARTNATPLPERTIAVLAFRIVATPAYLPKYVQVIFVSIRDAALAAPLAPDDAAS